MKPVEKLRERETRFSRTEFATLLVMLGLPKSIFVALVSSYCENFGMIKSVDLTLSAYKDGPTKQKYIHTFTIHSKMNLKNRCTN